MKKVGLSDWQEMALKKDIEDIKKKINSQEPILFSLCWELVIALGTIIVDHLFDTEQTPIEVWIFVICLGVIPPVYVLIKKFAHWLHSIYLVNKGIVKNRAYIDAFDNQVSYWVMLSNSYADMLNEAISDINSTDAEKEFLYREGCYYNNKSMQMLYSMKPNFDKIFSLDINDIKRKNLIDLARLYNILEVMNEQQIQLDRDIEGVLSRGISLQQSMNKKYLDELNAFLVDINLFFPSSPYHWKSN